MGRLTIWTLCKTVRTARGPRQEVVAHLGKEPGLDNGTRHGWEEVADLLEGGNAAPRQGRLGEQLPRACPRPQWAHVDLRGVRVERVREFGRVYLALSLWRRLGLHSLLAGLITPGMEAVPWELTACILTAARFCGQKSEFKVAERWYADSALEDLLGVPFPRVNDARLYRGLDRLPRTRKHFVRTCSSATRAGSASSLSSCSMTSPARILKAKPRATRRPRGVIRATGAPIASK